MRFLPIAIFYIFTQTVSANNKLTTAYSNAGLSKGYTLEQNINLALSYLQTSHANGGREENARVRKLIQNRDIDGLKKVLGTALPAELLNDDLIDLAGSLDMYRTQENFLNEKGRIVAPGCRTNAILFTQLLKKSGFSAENIFILETVNEDDLRAVCPTLGGKAVSKFSQGLSGHTYVLLNLPGKGWRLFDTNYSLYSKQNASGNGFSFMSPAEIKAGKQPVKVPDEANPYSSRIGNLYAFSVEQVDREVNYKYSQRVNMVASGNPSDPTCKKALAPQAGKSSTAISPSTEPGFQ